MTDFPALLEKHLATGATRHTLLTRTLAIKLPAFAFGWTAFLYGLLANLQERSFSLTRWDELAPVLFADPIGLLVVMPRAVGLTDPEWQEFDFDAFVNRVDGLVPAERKQSSFGWLNGRIVAIDYGN